jgi:hypothetical protein
MTSDELIAASEAAEKWIGEDCEDLSKKWLNGDLPIDGAPPWIVIAKMRNVNSLSAIKDICEELAQAIGLDAYFALYLLLQWLRRDKDDLARAFMLVAFGVGYRGHDSFLRRQSQP